LVGGSQEGPLFLVGEEGVFLITVTWHRVFSLETYFESLLYCCLGYPFPCRGKKGSFVAGDEE